MVQKGLEWTITLSLFYRVKNMCFYLGIIG
jgi:hypothetical protein